MVVPPTPPSMIAAVTGAGAAAWQSGAHTWDALNGSSCSRSMFTLAWLTSARCHVLIKDEADSLAVLHTSPLQQCVAPHIVKQIPTKVVARPWTEVNKPSLICALPPLPSSRRLAVCEHNNILSGQTWQILNPFTRGDFLTTSCSPLSQVNESEAWSSAEASSCPVSLNLGAAPPPSQQQQRQHLTPSPRGSGLSQ